MRRAAWMLLLGAAACGGIADEYCRRLEECDLLAAGNSFEDCRDAVDANLVSISDENATLCESVYRSFDPLSCTELQAPVSTSTVSCDGIPRLPVEARSIATARDACAFCTF